MELTVDGLPVFAATGGRPFDPGLPCVAFLHGAGMDHSVWALQTRFFAHRGWSVLALDLPGHGRSAGAPVERIEAAAAWLWRAVEAAGRQGPVALVGHSMGAAIALEAAALEAAGGEAAEAGRVRALALLGAAARLPVHPDLLAAARRADPRAAAMITGWGYGREARLGGHRVPGLWHTGGGFRLLERGLAALGADLAACAAWDGSAACAALDVPTLVLCGGADRMTPPRQGRTLADAIAGARLQILPGAGHMLMQERPDETLDALAGLLGPASP